jgi:8-oxo-dGTP pyrophosphatase MutT (NUDIX family)
MAELFSRMIQSLVVVALLTLCLKENFSCSACSTADKDSVFFPDSAGCLIRNSDNQILLVKDTNGEWSFPGGSIDCFEDAEGAAERETYEEAGVTVTVGATACGDATNAFQGYCCTENPSGQTPSIDNNVDNEIVDAQWLTRAELDALADSQLKFPYQRELLEDVVDGTIC